MAQCGNVISLGFGNGGGSTEKWTAVAGTPHIVWNQTGFSPAPTPQLESALTTWTNPVMNYGTFSQCVAWSPLLKKWVVGRNTASWSVEYSSDGTSWSAVNILNAPGAICWVPSPYNRFVAVSTAVGEAYYSTNASSWTTVTVANQNWRGIAYSPTLKRIVAVSPYSYSIYSDDGGSTWSAANFMIASFSPYSICWSEAKQLFIAVGGSGPTRIASSTDGISWTNEYHAGTSPTFQSVIYSTLIGAFVAVANSGTGRIQISGNGKTWLQLNTMDSVAMKSITEAPEISTFIVTQESGATPNAYTTTDTSLQSWTPRYSVGSASSWNAIAASWSPERGQILVIQGGPSYATCSLSGLVGLVYPSSWVGIQTTLPAYQLDLATDGARKLTTNSWLTGSDEKLKEDIQTADYDRCYEIVKALDLKYFKWREDLSTYKNVLDRHALGWIAQEVEQHFPNAVEDSVVDNLPAKVLDVDQIYKALYGAIRKLLQEVATLREKVYHK